MTGAKTQILALAPSSTTQALEAPINGAPVLPLVARLRALREEKGSNLVVTVAPFTLGLSTRALLREVAEGLIRVQEGPVLAISLLPGSAQGGGQGDSAESSYLEPGDDLGESLPGLEDAVSSGVSFLRLSSDPKRRLAFVSSDRFSSMIAAARKRFRHTLIEGSAAGPDVETILAARASDAAILVAGRGVTRAGEAADAYKMLAGCGVRLLGYVFDRNPVLNLQRK